MPLKPSPLQPSSRPLLSQSFTDAQAWTHAFSWGHQRVAKVADCVLCLGSLCLWVCLAGQAWYLPGATVFGLFCAPMSRGFGERSGVTRTVPGARTKGQCSTRRGASRAVLERRMGSSGARKEADRGGRRGSCRGSRPPLPTPAAAWFGSVLQSLLRTRVRQPQLSRRSSFTAVSWGRAERAPRAG